MLFITIWLSAGVGVGVIGYNVFNLSGSLSYGAGLAISLLGLVGLGGLWVNLTAGMMHDSWDDTVEACAALLTDVQAMSLDDAVEAAVSILNDPERVTVTPRTPQSPPLPNGLPPALDAWCERIERVDFHNFSTEFAYVHLLNRRQKPRGARAGSHVIGWSDEGHNWFLIAPPSDAIHHPSAGEEDDPSKDTIYPSIWHAIVYLAREHEIITGS
ncbi:MAG: hypothetical protein AAF432_05355 [Planctomycetota bacterium]